MLVHIGCAGDLFGLFASSGQGRDKDRDQQSDDRYNHEDLDEGEPS